MADDNSNPHRIAAARWTLILRKGGKGSCSDMMENVLSATVSRGLHAVETGLAMT